MWLTKYACSFIFLKYKLLKVLLFSIEPSTYSITISTTFMYSFSLWTRMGFKKIFNHIWVIGFTFVVFWIIYLSIMTHSEFEKNVCTSSNTILCLLCNVQNVVLMREKWERKYLTTSLSNQYYEYTMPKVAIISTSRNV